MSKDDDPSNKSKKSSPSKKPSLDASARKKDDDNDEDEKICEDSKKEKKPDKTVTDTASKKEVALASKPEAKTCEASSKKPETKVSEDSSKKSDIKQKLGAGIFAQQDKLKDMVGSLREKVLQFAPKIDMNQLKKIDYKTAIKNAFNAAKEWIILNCDPKKMADKPGAPSRPMKFPYTFSAKIAQFPLTHYVKNQWIWRYYFVAVGVCIPVFWSINKLANSPGNVAKWAEIRRKEAAEHHH